MIYEEWNVKDSHPPHTGESVDALALVDLPRSSISKPATGRMSSYLLCCG
jgi:hypothetical protein